jgi:N-formylglutamate amidohydrolase
VLLVAVGILAAVSTTKLHSRTNQLHAAQTSLAQAKTQLNSDNATIASQRSRIDALRACLSDIVTLGNEVRANNTKAADATITKVQLECAPLGFP